MGRIAIRREDKGPFERRVPLTPDHVHELVDQHQVAVEIEHSETRIFSDEAYTEVGASLGPISAESRVVFGVKEIPLEKLEADKTYLYFAHVIKGQPKNMPALKRLIELGSTLIDYERIVDAHNRRLLFFSRHAGYAGMIDTLWALGQRLAARGLETPFRSIRPAHAYADLEAALRSIKEAGLQIRHDGLPEALWPMVFAFTGLGNVTAGAVEIFDRLPFDEIWPEDLAGLAEDPDRPRNVVYKVMLRREHRYCRLADGGFDALELSEHPARYRSALPDWLPHISVLVHGVYWDPRQPRLLEGHHLIEAESRGELRLEVIGDITCDVGGSLEMTVEPTTPAEPAYVWNPIDGSIERGVDGKWPAVLAVDNLPCELPIESSEHFGDHLMRWAPALARCDFDRPLDELELPMELKRAIIVHRGELCPEYLDLKEAIAEHC